MSIFTALLLPCVYHAQSTYWGKGTWTKTKIKENRRKTKNRWRTWDHFNMNPLYLSWRAVCQDRCPRRASCGTCCAARGSRRRGCPLAAPHQQGREPGLCSPCIAQNMLCVLQWWQQKKKQSPPLDEKMKWQWTHVTWTSTQTTRTYCIIFVCIIT